MNVIVDTILQEPEVNRLARLNRHLRVFSKPELIKIHALGLVRSAYAPVIKLKDTPFIQNLIASWMKFKAGVIEVLPVSPQKRLTFQAVFIACAVLLASAFTSSAGFSGLAMDYSNDYIDSYYLPGDILVADEEGYLVKINPQTEDGTRIGMTDYAVHTVASGESLSVIAEQYKIGVNTIMWENGMANGNSLRIGQKLLIPPVNGVSYKAKSGDTLEKIAKTYKVTAEAIVAQNGLKDSVIVKGQNLFLPGAEPIRPVVAANANYRAVTASRGARSYDDLSDSDTAPAIGKIFIFPTSGKITQKYRAGHYALDIADRSRPAVWAAAAGTVVKASSGTYGGGYGNHIIIDHGDGVKTLYAHLDSLNAEVGDTISQGDVIGIMGNTGRVYGATGIHLHFEVIINGVKKNPVNYY